MPLVYGGDCHRIWNDSSCLLFANLQHRDRRYQQLRYVTKHIAVERKVIRCDVQVSLQQDVAYQRAAVVVQYSFVRSDLMKYSKIKYSVSDKCVVWHARSLRTNYRFRSDFIDRVSHENRYVRV